MVLAGSGSAEWVQTGSAYLNINGNESGSSPHIETDPGGTFMPHVAWKEFSAGRDQVNVSKWETSIWTQQGVGLNRINTHTASAARLIINSTNTPYATWLEQNDLLQHEVFVSFYSGSWSPIGAKINTAAGSSAHTPDIVLEGTTPIVCWQDEVAGEHKIKVVRRNGSFWDLVGTELNFNGSYNAFRPRMASYSAEPFVTWYEESAGQTQIYVKTWNSTAWELVGAGSLNIDGNKAAQNPDIFVDSTSPYVAWDENTGTNTEIFVKCFNSTSWEQLGTGSVNISSSQDAHSPSITLSGSMTYVTWCESDGNTLQVYVKKYNGTNWEPIGGSLNMDANFGVKDPSIAVVNGTPYVIWEEWDATLKNKVYVKHWDDTLLTTTATPSATSTVSATLTPTRTATPSATGTVTYTQTPTSTPTATMTLTATETIVLPTDTYTPTTTVSPTVSQSATGTPTSTPSPIHSPTHTPTIDEPSLTSTPTGTPTYFVPQETETPTPQDTAGEDSTPAPSLTSTATERKRKPDKVAPVVIRGNVLKPSSKRPVQIAVFLEKPEHVKVKIYSMRGKLIKTLVDEVVQAGSFESAWEGVNKNGSVVRSGIYIVYIETESFKEKRKMVVIR
jgi:FlgD Ig-like domain